MGIENRIKKFRALADEQQNLTAKYRREINRNSLLRLTVFIVGAVLAYLFYAQTVPVISICAATAIAFSALLKRHNKLHDKRAKSQTLAQIAQDELKAFNHDFSPFDGAPEKIDPAHNFSFDLDIFSERSVFQLLNRTSLGMGKETLAQMVENPLKNGNKIHDRQQATKELSGKEEFCFQFRTIGLLSDDAYFDKNAVKQLGNSKPQFPNAKFWTAATFVVPALYVLFAVFSMAGIISGGKFILLYLITLIFSTIPMKRVKKVWRLFDKKTKLLQSYAELLQLFEENSFESPLLTSLQNSIKENNLKGSSEIKKLAQYSRNLDLSFAVPVLFILNPFFLWNVAYALKIEKWMQKNASEIEKWFSVLAKTDALISLGSFTANNPDYVYPTMSDSFCLRGKNIGHPLIPRHKCVRNDIDIASKPFFMIVTGANMAGKSTYLRTVGVNLVLASIGLPVCADAFTFYPGKLLTNLRTADSLVNNESYFFAELKRLKMIISQLESGEDGLFIILDEILKGTNSEDKQKGSFQLMKRLVNLGGNGIIATHDLTLSELENQFPKEIENVHFDAEIKDDTLSFDYKLQQGVAKTMNANFLMRKMGIIE